MTARHRSLRPSSRQALINHHTHVPTAHHPSSALIRRNTTTQRAASRYQSRWKPAANSGAGAGGRTGGAHKVRKACFISSSDSHTSVLPMTAEKENKHPTAIDGPASKQVSRPIREHASFLRPFYARPLTRLRPVALDAHYTRTARAPIGTVRPLISPFLLVLVKYKYTCTSTRAHMH